MKFIGLDGKTHGKDVGRYVWDGGRCASRGETELGDMLRGMFPNLTIYHQLPCVGTDLRLDFLIYTLKTAFEFDGIQHKQFNPHFHRSRRGFLRAQENDRIKEEWCDVNGFRLIRVDENTIENLEEMICE